MSYEKLRENIIDVIIEGQLKLGYQKEDIRLYYPLSSLNNYLETTVNEEEMLILLEEFSRKLSREIGSVSGSLSGDRFCITVSAEGVEYVHNNNPQDEFLKSFVAIMGKHDTTIEEVKDLFYKYSNKVHFENIENGEFNYLLFFEKGQPDSYRYCITDEGCHLSYHRFSKEDYSDLIVVS